MSTQFAAVDLKEENLKKDIKDTLKTKKKERKEKKDR